MLEYADSHNKHATERPCRDYEVLREHVVRVGQELHSIPRQKREGEVAEETPELVTLSPVIRIGRAQVDCLGQHCEVKRALEYFNQPKPAGSECVEGEREWKDENVEDQWENTLAAYRVHVGIMDRHHHRDDRKYVHSSESLPPHVGLECLVGLLIADAECPLTKFDTHLFLTYFDDARYFISLSLI